MSQEKLPPLSKSETEEYVRNWKKNGIQVRLSFHLKVERAYRNISIRDCEDILTTGDLLWPPLWDEEYLNFVYKIVGDDLGSDDARLELVFCIEFETATIKVITGKPQC
jgi:hypothetical protein